MIDYCACLLSYCFLENAIVVLATRTGLFTAFVYIFIKMLNRIGVFLVHRWFDKCFSLIFTKDGMTALNFEHGWGDGVAVMRYMTEVHKDTTNNVYVGEDSAPAPIDPTQYVNKLGENSRSSQL